MKQIIPKITVPDVTQTVGFYCDVLGFKFMMGMSSLDEQVVVSWDEDQPLDYALMQCGDVEIIFQSPSLATGRSRKSRDFAGATPITLFFEMEDLEAFYSLLQGKVVIAAPLSIGKMGFKEFYIEDNNGCLIGFGERV